MVDSPCLNDTKSVTSSNVPSLYCFSIKYAEDVEGMRVTSWVSNFVFVLNQIGRLLGTDIKIVKMLHEVADDYI